MTTTTEEVSFVVTPRIDRAIERVLDTKACNEDDASTLRKYRIGSGAAFDAEPRSIPLSRLQLVSSLFRPIADLKTDGCSGFLHELTEGSSVVAATPPVRRKNPEHEAFLARMRAKAEKREYKEMVRNLRPKEQTFDVFSGGAVDVPGDDHIPAALRAKRDATRSVDPIKNNPLRESAVGMNVIIVMITGFVVFWYVGKQFFYGDNTKGVMCGIVGLIGAMILEVTLLIVRDQKQQLREAHRLAASGDAPPPSTVGLDGAVAVMSGAMPPKSNAKTTAVAAKAGAADAGHSADATKTAAAAAGVTDANDSNESDSASGTIAPSTLRRKTGKAGKAGKKEAGAAKNAGADAKTAPAPPSDFEPFSFGRPKAS